MRTGLMSFAMSLGGSAFIAYGDLHTDDTGIIAALIGVTSFCAAAIEPRRAWLWALIVGAGVPLAEACARGLRRDHFLIALATMAFAFAGGYVAVLIRRSWNAIAR